jgi:hypothetical protein
MKLTPKQNQVINCLQNGWVLITDRDSKEIWCGDNEAQFSFGRWLFWNMVEKGLISQELTLPYNYILTSLGRDIKTKSVYEKVKDKYKNK